MFSSGRAYPTHQKTYSEQATYAIIGEPSSLEPVIGRKEFVTFKLKQMVLQDTVVYP